MPPNWQNTIIRGTKRFQTTTGITTHTRCNARGLCIMPSCLVLVSDFVCYRQLCVIISYTCIEVNEVVTRLYLRTIIRCAVHFCINYSTLMNYVICLVLRFWLSINVRTQRKSKKVVAFFIITTTITGISWSTATLIPHWMHIIWASLSLLCIDNLQFFVWLIE